jgi:DNA helicase HerA-like ATPase
MANRHGLVAGATGTGKTVTMQEAAEAFSRIGVPVFAADVKGDLSGISVPGKETPKLKQRVEQLQLKDFRFEGCPVTFWDVFGEQGHPIRATVSEMGPLLLSRILNLNDTQAGVLSLVFKIADDNGLLRGVVNLLAADKLMQSPQLYATFLLWLLSELFEKLPEVGDPDKPKLVFFFDEAHLLFTDQPAVLMTKIEQVVRLVRSKGVGVYFVTQNPLDVPDTVLGQLGNRVQHALRAFTPRDQKAVKAAAETFRSNPKLDVADAITQLGVGEALVSFLDGKGMPGVVERATVCPPHGQIGPITPEQRQSLMKSSLVAGVYDQAVDRESAYERLKGRAQQQRAATTQTQAASGGAGTSTAGGGLLGSLEGLFIGTTGPRGGHHDSVMEAMLKSGARSVGTQLGRQLVRGVLGSLLGGSRR